MGDITTYSDHCPLSISLTLNSNSQAYLHMLYQKSLELIFLTDIEDCQNPEACLDTETEPFRSLASASDLQRAFSDPKLILEVTHLVEEAQTLTDVKCAEKFVLLLKNYIMDSVVPILVLSLKAPTNKIS